MKLTNDEKYFIPASIIIQFILSKILYPDFSLFEDFFIALLITFISWFFVFIIIKPFYIFVYNHLKVIIHPIMTRIKEKYIY